MSVTDSTREEPHVTSFPQMKPLLSRAIFYLERVIFKLKSIHQRVL